MAFLSGYNAGVTGFPTARRALEGVTAFYRPFACEGAAMGFGPWALLHGVGFDAFEPLARSVIPETVYQNYVGLGWWLGMRHGGRPRPVARVASRLDRRYRVLVYEGLGFRWGFLHPERAYARAPSRRYDPDAAHVWHQGYGRSLWFVHLDDLDAVHARVRALPAAYRGDAYSGLGLGCAFSLLDRPQAVQATAATVPAAYRADFFQGVAFGWEARQRADRLLFDASVLRPGSPERARAGAAVDAVARARAELERRPPAGELYQCWRARTRDRLAAAGLTQPSAQVPQGTVGNQP